MQSFQLTRRSPWRVLVTIKSQLSQMTCEQPILLHSPQSLRVDIMQDIRTQTPGSSVSGTISAEAHGRGRDESSRCSADAGRSHFQRVARVRPWAPVQCNFCVPEVTGIVYCCSHILSVFVAHIKAQHVCAASSWMDGAHG